MKDRLTGRVADAQDDTSALHVALPLPMGDAVVQADALELSEPEPLPHPLAEEDIDASCEGDGSEESLPRTEGLGRVEGVTAVEPLEAPEYDEGAVGEGDTVSTLEIKGGKVADIEMDADCETLKTAEPLALPREDARGASLACDEGVGARESVLAGEEVIVAEPEAAAETLPTALGVMGALTL